ncbi:MAG: diaminopimelate decarboxylase [Mycobacteriales bacterium]
MRAHPAGVLHAGFQAPTDQQFNGPGNAGSPSKDLTFLDPAVWPHTATRNDGVLSIGGASVTELVAAHGTPLTLIDESEFHRRARACVAVFGAPLPESPDAPAGQVYYASKALLTRRIARWVRSDGLGLDVCTGGELTVALQAEFPPERITLHGNNKSVAELTQAITVGVGHVVVDSFTEIERLAAIARQHGVRVRVLVRVTVGVEAHTHEFIATAHEDQKFGFSLASGDAGRAIAAVLAEPSLRLEGVHSHIGSQIFDTSGFEVSAHRLIGVLAAVRDTHDIELPVLNLGGGFGIAYLSSDDPVDMAGMAAQLRRIVTSECAAAGLRVPRLVVEPGRAIAGPAGVTVYEVGTVKDVDGLRSYVSVDGGMSDNIRTALYDAAYTCVLANRAGAAEPMLARVVGKHCESGDIVVKDVWLPADVAPGDLLAVAATGAYCRSMASNYNMLTKPPLVSVAGGTSTVLLRRETLDDLLRLDVG